MMGWSIKCYKPSLMEIDYGEEDFLRFLLLIALGAILVNYKNFGSPFLKMLHMKFGFDWLSGFREDV